MKYTKSIYYGAALLMLSFALAGCPKKAEVTSSPESQKSEQPGTAVQNGENGQGKQSEAAGTQTGEEKSGTGERSGLAAAGLEPLYFDYDQSVIRADARKVLTSDAEWLKANPKVKVKIEGNCDDRGTIEYNQALGQRRAAAAKKFLTDLGIAGKRISLISYGKEKPACSSDNDECWQKNRRDDLTEAK